MREREQRELGVCAQRMLELLSDQPVTVYDLERAMKRTDHYKRKRALRQLSRRGLAVYLRASEGGPGWVRVLTPPRSA